MYQITHKTTYRYNDPVSTGNHQACLRPRELPYQTVREFSLAVTPEPTSITHRLDFFGNTIHTFSIQSQHQELTVEARSEVDVHRELNDAVGEDIPWEAAAQHAPDSSGPIALDAHQFRFESPRIRLRPEFAEYTRQSFSPSRPLREALLDLTARIHGEFKFETNSTHVGTTVEEVFAQRCGVCQDFAHLEIACLRSLGIAARYVSGYLRTTPPPGMPKLIGADASHAWLGVYCPDKGWLDLDPTNNVIANNDHITVAWGRDYGDVSPLRGSIIGGGVQALNVAVDVAPVEQAA